jgi:hypothetical protein
VTIWATCRWRASNSVSLCCTDDMYLSYAMYVLLITYDGMCRCRSAAPWMRQLPHSALYGNMLSGRHYQVSTPSAHKSRMGGSDRSCSKCWRGERPLGQSRHTGSSRDDAQRRLEPNTRSGIHNLLHARVVDPSKDACLVLPVRALLPRGLTFPGLALSSILVRQVWPLNLHILLTLPPAA